MLHELKFFMNTVYTIWLREMKRFLRSKSRIFGNISMPIMWLLIMGFGLNSSFSLPGIKFDYLNYMAPGIIGMTLLFSSVFSGVSVIYDKQFGFMKEILVAPVSRTKIALGKISGSAMISVINGLLVFIIAVIFGAISLNAVSFSGVLELLIFMVLAAVIFVAFGLAIASRLNDMEGFQMIMSFLVMPMFFLSGAFFPIENVPLWMKILAHLDPLMYTVDGLRAAILGHGVSQYSVLTNISILFAAAIVMVLISGALFNGMAVK